MSVKIFNWNITYRTSRNEGMKEWDERTKDKQIEIIDHQVNKREGNQLIQSIVYKEGSNGKRNLLSSEKFCD